MKRKIMMVAAILVLISIGGVAMVLVYTHNGNCRNVNVVRPHVEDGISNVHGQNTSRRNPQRISKGVRPQSTRPQSMDNDADDENDLMISDEAAAMLTPEERKAFAALREAYDDDNFKAVIAELGKLAKCSSVEVRKEIVSILGWFGVRAIPELMPYMADSDSEVVEEAVDRWKDALSDMSGSKKANLIEQTMKVLTDKDTLDSIASELNSDIPNSIAIQTLINLIQSGNNATVEVAKETYEFMTGDEYTTPDAAREWLAENPDDE